MPEVLVGVLVGALIALGCLAVIGQIFLMTPGRSTEDEALEIAVRRLLCSTEIRAVADLVPDHVARLRLVLEELGKVQPPDPAE